MIVIQKGLTLLMLKKNKGVSIMIDRKQLWRGWFMPCLCVLMFVLGIIFEKKLSERWLNCSVIEGRSRGIVLYIELSKKVFATGDKDLMKRFMEDSYAKRNQLCKGADSEDFIFFWTDWETDVETIMKSAHAETK